MSLIRILTSKRDPSRSIYESEKLLLLSLIGRPNSRLLLKKLILKRPWLVRILIVRGCNVNIRNHWKCTPLHAAAIYGYPACVRLLLTNGANIDARDDINWTPLHYVAKNNHPVCVCLLLAGGVNANAKK